MHERLEVVLELDPQSLGRGVLLVAAQGRTGPLVAHPREEVVHQPLLGQQLVHVTGVGVEQHLGGAAVDQHLRPAAGPGAAHGVLVLPLRPRPVGSAVRPGVLGEGQRGPHPRPQHHHHDVALRRPRQPPVDRRLRRLGGHHRRPAARLVPRHHLEGHPPAHERVVLHLLDHRPDDRPLPGNVTGRGQEHPQVDRHVPPRAHAPTVIRLRLPAQRDRDPAAPDRLPPGPGRLPSWR
ncbi:hypothetical protein SBRY_40129 [Actinacidiphila bryophytorum]|uniref:Uncharacterized protein n=1 Tax=Actinacidiphila bryophytorum TaxID=1436133 RepID=A0A9W4MGD0_9ACTN|nr:hypothetical protein SBRY_40129 [Actinacidiphila bryophytorum]